jgi:phosphate-selective porin OprO/OprP
VASPASDSTENTPQANDKTSQQEIPDQNENTEQRQGLVTMQINSLLVDKEIPLIGGKWGGDIFLDIPLNKEPDDASVTLRKARLKYSRTLTENWKLKLSSTYNTNSGLELDDSYLVYKGWARALVTIGINDPPFSLESSSSSDGQTFMEKSLAVVALSETKGGGFTFLKRTPTSILNSALILTTPSQDNKREAGQALIFHYVYSPITLHGKDNIHLGGSFSYRVNTDAKNTQFRSRPEIGTTELYFVDTGEVDGANKIIRASLEASRVDGRFSWQAELLTTQVKRDGFESASFWGAYAYVSWFLTDDSRNYNSGTGLFEPLTPKSPAFKGGRGAFELAFRASYVDLTDEDVVGGEESNLSLGFNWYLNQKLRLMTNVIKVLDVKRPGSEYDGQSPLIFALRAQWLMQ